MPVDGESTGDRIVRVTRDGGAGLTYDELRAKRFRAPSRGVRIDTSAEPGDHDRIDAGLSGAVDRAVVTDVDAARLWGLPLPPWMQDVDKRPVSLAVSAGTAEPQRVGVRGRRLRLPEEHVTEVDGRRVTTPARTWLDCAAEMPVANVVAMGDFGLARSLMASAELRALLRWAYRRRGVAVARRAFPLLDPAAASPGESVTRVQLMAEGVPRPVCNHDVIESGGWLARVDMAWPEFRVAVEYDGLVHLEEGQRRRDAQRRNLLQEHGWIVITATADDHRRPWVLAQQVRDALRSRGWTPRPAR